MYLTLYICNVELPSKPRLRHTPRAAWPAVHFSAFPNQRIQGIQESIPSLQTEQNPSFYSVPPELDCTKLGLYIPDITYRPLSVEQLKSIKPTMRKAVIYTTTVSAVVLTIIILCWKYWPSSSPEIIPPGPGEVIEEKCDSFDSVRLESVERIDRHVLHLGPPGTGSVLHPEEESQHSAPHPPPPLQQPRPSHPSSRPETCPCTTYPQPPPTPTIPRSCEPSRWKTTHPPLPLHPPSLLVP